MKQEDIVMVLIRELGAGNCDSAFDMELKSAAVAGVCQATYDLGYEIVKADGTREIPRIN
jgi:hypothetical protein